jgi:putative chitinase
MSVTIESRDLVQAGLASPADATRWAGPLTDACARFGIDTPERVAAFLAQIAHESARFTATTENLNYSAVGLARTWPKRFAQANLITGRIIRDAKGDPIPNASALQLARRPEAIANTVYANRIGNGDVASGDGWRFRGRGLIQLTGRANYAEYASAMEAHDFIMKNPDLVAHPPHAATSAAWFWSKRGLNALADSGDLVAMTRVINGGTHGIENRALLYASARQVFTA